VRRFVLGCLLLLAVAPPVGASLRPHADGLGSCSSGGAPFAFHGSCGTFNNANTWYGTHGPGFPTPLGWGLCAVPAAHGGFYPAPAYKYTATTPPTGITTGSLSALGWAFSDAQRRGWWTNGNGTQFTKNDLGVAAKLLYDHYAWKNALPSTPPAVVRAIQSIQGLVTTGLGITATPNLTVTLDGGGTTLATTGVLRVRVVVPGANTPLAGASVNLTITNATFDASRLSTVTLSTAGDGSAVAAFTTSSGHPSLVNVVATTTVATPGLLFYGPSTIALNAQVLASPRAPVALTAALALTSTGTPRGTLTIVKSVDDGAYLAPADAVFQVLAGDGSVVATLVTGTDGTTGVTDALPVGTYVVHEAVPPTGYDIAPDQSVSVVANTLTTLSVGPAQGDLAQRASVELSKVDRSTATPLAGATFTLTYDTANTGVADGTPVSCTTDATGHCLWANLLPGWYQLVETAPAPHYEATNVTTWIEAGPNAAVTITVANDPVMMDLVARKFNAATNVVIPNATYDLYAATPGPPGAPAHLPEDAASFAGYQWFARGVTDAAGDLHFAVRTGYTWCLHEVAVPAGYVIDPSLHCTTSAGAGGSPTVALPEVHSPITLRVLKFNADQPSTGVPHATYALFVLHGFPAGFTPPPTPTDLVTPPDATLWAIADTNDHGQLDFEVPSGFTWCVRELAAPSDYILDPALHCTATTLTVSSPSSVTTVALPETLAVTGGSPLWPLGLALVVVGSAFVVRARRSAVGARPSRSRRPSR
jgi:Prealbumin-like fold domain